MTPTGHQENHAAAKSEDTPERCGTTFETLAVCGFIFGIFSIVASVFAVGLAAQGAEGDRGDGAGGSEVAAPSGVSTLDVTLKDFAFDPDDLRVDAGAVPHPPNDGSVDRKSGV